GHDLEMVVTQWSATFEVGEPSSVILSADSSSFRVREGRGGIQALDEGDKDNIRQTIDDEVLKHTSIEFRSTEVNENGDRVLVRGELQLMGEKRPLQFELELRADGRLTGKATVKQTDWGMKPYSALFGTLKVADEIDITVQASVQSR